MLWASTGVQSTMWLSLVMDVRMVKAFKACDPMNISTGAGLGGIDPR